MRTQPTRLIVAALALGLLTFSLAPAGANELLAGGSLQDLIGGGGQPAPQTPPSGKGLTKDTLAGFLKSAGYQGEDLGNGLFKVTVKSGTWTIPVYMTLSGNGQFLWYVTNLSTIEEGTQIPVDKLLALLATNGNNGLCFFQYSTKMRKIQITEVAPTHEMTPAKMKNDVDYLISVALKYEPLWNPAKWGQSGGAAAKHVGSWVASTPKMSYRLTLNANGTFTLATRTQQGTNTTSGRFTLNGDQLLLQSGDDTLKATLLWTAADTFVFKLEGSQGNALTFQRG